MKISEISIRRIISEEIDKVLFEKIKGRSRPNNTTTITVDTSRPSSIKTIQTDYGTIILDDPDAIYVTPVPILTPGDQEMRGMH